MVDFNSSKCSSNCGKGYLTTMRVICKGKEDRNEVNVEIQSSENCTINRVRSTCYGTDPNCPGIPFILYGDFQKLKIIISGNQYQRMFYFLKYLKGLWTKKVEKKTCINHRPIQYVTDQLECQQRCIKESSCVGISYSYSSLHIGYCKICLNDDLSNSETNYGFYRRPGK